MNEYDTISSNLRKISDLNIINLGRGGTASLSHLALISEYAPKNIKSIVWIYYENDVIDLDFELSSLTLKKYLNDEKFTQNLKYKQNFIDNLHLNDHKSLIKKLSKKDRNDEILRIYGTFNTDNYSYLKLYTLRNFIRERFFEKEKKYSKRKKKHRLKFNQNF